MDTTQTTRQLYPPAESPYEPMVGGTLPHQVYPSDLTYPSTTGEPGFRLGTLHLEVPGVMGIAHIAEVLYRNPTQDESAAVGILLGDLDTVDAQHVYSFWEPPEFYPVRLDVGDNRLLTAHYRDYAQKHPDLKRPYEVTLIVEYLEKHPAVEAIADQHLRERIYQDLINSDFVSVIIDVDKYIADPDYSAVQALRTSLARFIRTGAGDFHPNVETQMLTKPSTNA